MQLAHSLTRISALALGVAGALACGQVHAAAFQLKENSVQGLGRSYAGGASAPNDCSMVANNAAAIGDIGSENCIQVDLNVVPASMVERVENLAVGGAPTYGSDAIAGVVNLILKQDYEGTEIGGNFGITGHEARAKTRRVGTLAGAADFQSCERAVSH